MNKAEVCNELIKVANQLDKSGDYELANELTKTAEQIANTREAFNFFSVPGYLAGKALFGRGGKRGQQQSNTGGFLGRALSNVSGNLDNRTLDAISAYAMRSGNQQLTTQAQAYFKARNDLQATGKALYNSYRQLLNPQQTNQAQPVQGQQPAVQSQPVQPAAPVPAQPVAPVPPIA